MKSILIFLAMSVLGLPRVAVAQTPETQNPPNIVFILADDWGWGDLGCQGNRRIRTPNIDRLAEAGTRFEQFYVSAAVCSPSRASFMTGLFTDRHGIHSHLDSIKSNRRRRLPRQLDPSLAMLPRLLRTGGYTTAHFGKWHLCTMDDPSVNPPSEYGIDRHRITVGSGSARHMLPRGLPGFNTWEDSRPGPDWNGWRGDASRRIFDEAIQFMEQNRDRPFYIQAWMYDTHGPMKPTPSQMHRFAEMPLPYRMYYGAVADSDRHVGRLLNSLDALGLARNTIVIFSSDNGPEDMQLFEVSAHGVGEAGPFRGRKRSGYEGGIRMPFIVRWPAVTPAGRVDRQTVLSAVDLLPSLCSVAGVKVLSSLDGEDMSEAWRGRSLLRSKPLFWDLRENTQGPLVNRSPKQIIRDGDWKLLRGTDGLQVELYNIQENSLEVDNLADTHPQVVERLMSQLDARFGQR